MSDSGKGKKSSSFLIPLAACFELVEKDRNLHSIPSFLLPPPFPWNIRRNLDSEEFECEVDDDREMGLETITRVNADLCLTKKKKYRRMFF